jgi:hypothetical protein
MSVRKGLEGGLILVPTRYAQNLYTDKFVRMFRRMEETHGCRVVVADDIDPAKTARETSFVVVFKPTQWNRPANFTGVLGLPAGVKVFGLWDDIHQGKRGPKWWTGDYRVLTRFFKRCDGIFCTYDHAFRKWYPKFSGKLIHLPHFYSDEDFREVPYNEHPVMKCLLSGATGEFYPLRRHAMKNPGVVVLPHPGYGADSLSKGDMKFGKGYAEELSKYFCGVTCSSIIDYPVAKYMEIPAAGCLLLASHTPDLDALGYRDGVNYVRVDEKNFDSKLADVLANPGNYEGVRRAGYEFVRSRHSDLIRADQMAASIEAVLNKDS